MREGILWLSLFVIPAHGWVGSTRARRISRIAVAASPLPSGSTPSLAEASGSQSDEITQRGAISMSITELSEYLGGTGRAKIVWDCYKIGVDPQNFFRQDKSISTLDQDATDAIFKLLPSCRRLQKLGQSALESLADSYQNAEQVEDGVARLSHLSTSSDLTTKMLLKLRDGLEVETVIIPVDGRSTLCISSQVGCRQGALVSPPLCERKPFHSNMTRLDNSSL